MTYINGGSFIAIGVLFPVLSSVTVATRFYIRRKRKISLGIDDWLCLPALVFVTGCAVTLIVGSAGHAVGYHSSPNANAGSDTRIVFLEKCEFAFNVMSPLALGFIKLAILFLYRRIFRGRPFDILNDLLITTVWLWTLAVFLVIVFQCRNHFSMNWGSLDENQRCLSTYELYLAYSVSDVIIDIFILILPLPLVWMLHMPYARKLAVTGIFLLGTMAIIAGILRMIVFIKLDGAVHEHKILKILGVVGSDDMTVVSLVMFWSMLEMGVALIAACLPILRPFFNDFSLESVIQALRYKISHRSLPNRSGHSSTNRDGTRKMSDDSVRATVSSGTIALELPEDAHYIDGHYTSSMSTIQTLNNLLEENINIRSTLPPSVELV